MNNFDQSALEEAAAALLRTAGVGRKVYHNRPASTTEDLTDFVVCKVTGAIDDRYAIGQCVLSIHLFARDVKNMKSGKKLSLMQGKVLSAMPRYISDGGFIIHGNPRILGDTSDGFGYHVRIINYKVTIKATQ